THTLLPKGMLKESCKLPFTYDHLVVQVDCDQLIIEGRRKLFTATREAMTSEGKALVREAVSKCLLEDPTLRAIEEDRRERQFQEGLTQDTEELRRELAEMLDRVRPGRFVIRTHADAGEEGKPRKRKRKKGYTRGAPHHTNPDFPSYLEIASRGDPLKFYLDSSRTLLLKTDAPNGFLGRREVKAELSLDIETGHVLSLQSQDVDFKNGWLRLTVEPVKSAKADFEFDMKVILTFWRDGDLVELADDRRGLIVEETGGGPDKEQKVDAPLIITVTEDMSQWTELEWDYSDVAEVKGDGGSSIIYVSMENEWFKGTLSRAKWSPTYLNYTKKRYVLQVAFHAFLLHEGILPKDEVELFSEALEDPDFVESLERAELVRAVRSILTALTTKGALEEIRMLDEGTET
ncbi:MAG: hypothetical protein LN417_04275, partial [Candidatus Thermoplasmatota archaeon]|nr:hypothetical protein [Candidatus Thermoplasmatota archaeon]